MKSSLIARVAGFGATAAFSVLAWATAAQGAEPGATPQANYYYLVFNNAAEGREEEFNRWYQQTHAPEVVSNQGVISAQRYVASELAPQNQPPRKYLTIYHIASDDLAATFKAFRQTSGSPQSQPMEPNSGVLFTYQVLGAPISGPGPRSFGKGPLKTHAFFVRNGPVVGQDAEFNQWYDSTHARDVAATAGVVSAQRFVISDVQRNANVAPPPARYLVMYTVVTDDIAAFFASLDQRARGFVISKSFDPKSSTHFIYEEIGPPITKAAASAGGAGRQP